MSNTKYSMSFTTGALFYLESITLATLYLKKKDWDSVRTTVLAGNLLQARTVNTSKKVYSEIASRLKLLANQEIDLLHRGTRQEQNLLLWLAVCKRYRFIRDFAVEVLREKFLKMNLEIDAHDYNSFFNSKTHAHAELDKLSPLTVQKQRQIIFKMLKEAELISNRNTILPVTMSPQLIKTVFTNSPQYLDIYPVSEADIQEWHS